MQLKAQAHVNDSEIRLTQPKIFPGYQPCTYNCPVMVEYHFSVNQVLRDSLGSGHQTGLELERLRFNALTLICIPYCSDFRNVVHSQSVQVKVVASTYTALLFRVPFWSLIGKSENYPCPDDLSKVSESMCW
jgi:hypothetical protein